MDNSFKRQNLGKRIASIRKQKDISQKTLALMAGINRSYLVDIEAGRYSISFDKLCRITSALDISLSELMNDIDTPPS